MDWDEHELIYFLFLSTDYERKLLPGKPQRNHKEIYRFVNDLKSSNRGLSYDLPFI